MDKNNPDFYTKNSDGEITDPINHTPRIMGMD